MGTLIATQTVVNAQRLAPVLRNVLQRANDIAQDTRQPLNLVPLLLAILERDDLPIAQMLIAHGVTADVVRSAKRGA